MPHPQPTGVIFIPRDREVPLTQLVAGFEGIYNALCDRAAHFADRRDGESAARIGRLLFRLQAWIGSWWNDHLFRVELRIKRDEPPFADNPARLNNFATWWLFTSPQQREVVNYLTRLGQKIREGRFDNKAQLPSFDDIAVKLELYTPKERPASNSYGLSPRLSRASVQKAESLRLNALERGSYQTTPSHNKSFVAPQLVPILTQFSVQTVDHALLSVHNGVKREGINLEAFETWGRTWWMRLFAAHADKAYLALWYCLTEAQRGEAIDFFVHCGLRLSSEREQALLPFENSPLAQELRDPQAARALAGRRTLRSPCGLRAGRRHQDRERRLRPLA
ncbi:RHTO0S26e00672g2_1 [Rhodotorula toruloides]|uniref:RHTO0S26e00672g2_1 n=1 Tax=Rhodotorula toruloides TaxID=5286 RepID=A0A061BN25_RHOTO|nr:RHTO0S26e00672g2_1 [Rhodotorula toruloides]